MKEQDVSQEPPNKRVDTYLEETTESVDSPQSVGLTVERELMHAMKKRERKRT